MINQINSIDFIAPVEPLTGSNSSAKTEDFSQVLRSAIDRVECSQASANSAVEAFLSGDSQDLHSTILATQKASLDFDFLLQVRNKVVQTYQEVMRMQL